MAFSVELLHRSDNRYGRFVTASMKFDADRDRGQIKDPLAGDHQVNLQILEDATLKWLSRYEDIFTDSVLLSPSETTPWGGPQFYELDFIGGTVTSPILFGEIKHSISARSALQAARKQLRKRMTLGASRWPGVAGMAICFDMAWGDSMLDRVSPSLLRMEEVCKILSARPNQNEIISIIGDGSELVARLVSDGMLDSSFPEKISDSFRLMKNPLNKLERSSPGFSLGNAFNRLDVETRNE